MIAKPDHAMLENADENRLRSQLFTHQARDTSYLKGGALGREAFAKPKANSAEVLSTLVH